MTKVLLVAVHHRQSDFEESVEETKQLIEACDYEWLLTVTQNSSDETPTYVKSGKVDELIDHITNQEVDMVVTNDELSPSQHRNLEEILGVDVMDRTQLILNIFEKRAQSKEAKLQVEVATLSYLLPRTNLQLHTVGRQRGGGARNKGAGEKALALSKRVTEKQLMKAEVALKVMEVQRLTQRQKRHKNNMFTVALVGYTNAGKSTLMNQLMRLTAQNDKLVSEKNRLFETLQTATRIIETQGNRFILSDTVGFVSRLPHNLVKSFRSTLEEVKDADLLIHVADGSSDKALSQQQITLDTLKDMEVSDKPMITVYNKMDLVERSDYPELCISAKTGDHCDDLLDLIVEKMQVIQDTIKLLIPYEKNNILKSIQKEYQVESIQSVDEGYLVKVKFASTLDPQYLIYRQVD